MRRIDSAEIWQRILKRAKPYLYILGALICLGSAWNEVYLNRSDLLALQWHLGHGFRTSCCGLQTEVPLKYRPDDNGQWGIYLSNMPGRFRSTYLGSGFSMVSIFPVRRTGTSAQDHLEEGIGRIVSFKGKHGCSQTGVLSIPAAATEFKCYEFECSSIIGIAHQNLFGRFEALCFGDQLRASFFGADKEEKADFYAVLKTLRRVH
jgi:hypothetical protein